MIEEQWRETENGGRKKELVIAVIIWGEGRGGGGLAVGKAAGEPPSLKMAALRGERRDEASPKRPSGVRTPSGRRQDADAAIWLAELPKDEPPKGADRAAPRPGVSSPSK